MATRPRRDASTRFETMPSSPSLQTCLKMVGPSPVRCSTNRMARRWDLPSSLASCRLRCRSDRLQIAVVLDQVEGVEHHRMAGAPGAQRMEVRPPVVAGDHRLTVDQERCAP